MVKLEVAVILLFAISFALYMGGYQPLFFQMLDDATVNETIIWGDENNITVTSKTVIDPIRIFSSSAFTAAVGITTLSVIVAGLVGAGYAVVYIIPFSIALFFFTTFFAFPLSFINEVGLPIEIRLFLIGIFFTLQTLAIVAFISGRE